MSFYNKGDWEFDLRDIFSLSLRCGKGLALLILSVAASISVERSIEWVQIPATVPWLQCDPAAIVEPDMQSRLLDANIYYGCTTQNVKRAMPCMCCVQGHCWRDAVIEKNGSDTAYMWDRLEDGRTMKRELPGYINVEYTELGSANVYSRQEKGALAGDVLRAMEILHNLPHAGEERPADEL